MAPVKAHVRNGRLVLDEPTDLPEGAEVSLLPADWDAMDEEDRRRLDDALAASEQDFAVGDVVSAEELLAKLHQA